MVICCFSMALKGGVMSMDPEMMGLEEDAIDVFRQHDIMKLFDELTFRQKWTRVSEGLKQPRESGEHKWARLQMLRLLSPIMSVVVPVLMLLLIVVLAKLTPAPPPSVEVTIVDPTPPEKLEELEPPEIEKLEPPDPTDIQVEVAGPVSLPSDVITPPAEAASVQPAEFDTVAQVKSPVIMAGILGSRNPGTRGAALGAYGGGHTVEAVLRALRWLKKNQSPDGSWGSNKAAMTALALLTYLAHGDTPASEEFGDTVERAIRFLVEAQESNGRFKGRDGHDYTQPIVAYALAEAWGMTKIPMVKTAAVKAIEIVAKGQNASGSFDYGLKPGGTGRDDLSYAAWCVQALKAASIAGLEYDVPEIKTAMERAIKGTKVHFKQGDSSSGTFGYAAGGGRYPGLTGAGVLSLQFLGDGQSREAKAGLAGMAPWAFNWKEPPAGSIVYYWYYITQAYFQEGGAVWDAWNASFSAPLIAEQIIERKDVSGYVDHLGKPQDIGHWVSPAAREMTGGNGKVMDTVLCTLMLEVYYRYLPTFQQITVEEIQKELGDDEDIVIDIVDMVPANRAMIEDQLVKATVR
jgi:hypothetical protein